MNVILYFNMRNLEVINEIQKQYLKIFILLKLVNDPDVKDAIQKQRKLKNIKHID